MNTEFVRITTEDQLVLQGLIYKPADITKKAYLHIHGMAGNFYENSFLDVMAQEITNIGYAFFVINTRGHDVVSDFPVVGTEEKYKRIGNAFEKFEECLLDIKSAVDYLSGQGYEKIVLCGHSLGSAKVAYYLAKTQDSRIDRLILMSPPDMVGLAESESYHKSLLAQAKQMVSSGEGEELLPLKIWGDYYLSAGTYVDSSVRDNPIDIFNTYDKTKSSLLREIRIPVFSFFGEKDDAVIVTPSEALDIIKSKAINAPIFETTIVRGSSHSYFGEERQMVDKIIKWLL
jgi:pimeloyl-ACP methyl ester carboxylesterase